eukprot:jgi/Psemu1/328281/estExt_fgenesh1_pg.C_11600001
MSLRTLIQRLHELAREKVPMPRSIHRNLERAVALRGEFRKTVIPRREQEQEHEPPTGTENWELLLPVEKEKEGDEEDDDDDMSADDEASKASLSPSSSQGLKRNNEMKKTTPTPEPPRERAKDEGLVPNLSSSLQTNPVQQFGSVWEMTSQGVDESMPMLWSGADAPVLTDEASSSKHFDAPEDWEMLWQEEDNEAEKENEESQASVGEVERALDANTNTNRDQKRSFLEGLQQQHREQQRQRQRQSIEDCNASNYNSATRKTVRNTISPQVDNNNNNNNNVLNPRASSSRWASGANKAKAPYDVIANGKNLDSVWDIFNSKETPAVGSSIGCAVACARARGPPKVAPFSLPFRGKAPLPCVQKQGDWESIYDL